MSDPSSKMNVYLQDKQWEAKAVYTVSGHMQAVTSALHLLILVFDKKRRIICPSEHTGTICSLMHIDVRIKANQAPLPSPHCPSPMHPPLCSCLKAWAPKPAQLTNPQAHNNDWGSLFKFAPAPHPPSPFILHNFIGVTYAECSHSSAY